MLLSHLFSNFPDVRKAEFLSKCIRHFVKHPPPRQYHLAKCPFSYYGFLQIKGCGKVGNCPIQFPFEPSVPIEPVVMVIEKNPDVIPDVADNSLWVDHE